MFGDPNPCAKNAEHFGPLFEQIAKLDEALYNIQFEQHWLEAQTDRQAICKPLLSRSLVEILTSYNMLSFLSPFSNTYIVNTSSEKDLASDWLTTKICHAQDLARKSYQN